MKGLSKKSLSELFELIETGIQETKNKELLAAQRSLAHLESYIESAKQTSQAEKDARVYQQAGVVTLPVVVH